MNWAKRAAEEIVSDDVIDEADAEKSSSQDWLKWALAAAALGTAGFAAWKYSPEIQKALGSTRLYDNRGLSNKLIDKVPGVRDVSTSPAVWGAMAGGMGQMPFAPQAIRESVLLGGKDAPLRTIPGQLAVSGIAQAPSSGGFTGDRANSALAEEVNKALGGDVKPPDKGDGTGVPAKASQNHLQALRALQQSGQTSEQSAFGKLRTWNPSQPPPADWSTHKGQRLTPDVGLGRSGAAADFDRITANSIELGRRLGSVVDYRAPELGPDGKPVLDPSGAPKLVPVQRRLSEVPEADRLHLAPEHRFAWDAHRHAAREAGFTDPAKFDIGAMGAATHDVRANLRRGFSIPHTARGAGIGAAVGGGGGLVVDAVGKAAE